ncbi:hypothetical protein RHMOL_Rhmol11G0015300 [Rhododendron molle]|uniref:Uncharacterized protein n=1 Tax=Rhododendron molle TaxID=49168 RepID=A0ACC0LMK0_RHOML|nr:hypothetical protein RHMOL_Rhmol11G0015300 [Rhododendron molle]
MCSRSSTDPPRPLFSGELELGSAIRSSGIHSSPPGAPFEAIRASSAAFVTHKPFDLCPGALNPQVSSTLPSSSSGSGPFTPNPSKFHQGFVEEGLSQEAEERARLQHQVQHLVGLTHLEPLLTSSATPNLVESNKAHAGNLVDALSESDSEEDLLEVLGGVLLLWLLFSSSDVSVDLFCIMLCGSCMAVQISSVVGSIFYMSFCFSPAADKLLLFKQPAAAVLVSVNALYAKPSGAVVGSPFAEGDILCIVSSVLVVRFVSATAVIDTSNRTQLQVSMLNFCGRTSEVEQRTTELHVAAVLCYCCCPCCCFD